MRNDELLLFIPALCRRADKEWIPNCSDVGRSESIIRYMASLEGFVYIYLQGYNLESHGGVKMIPK